MKACCNMFAVFQQKLDRCMYRIQAFFLGGGGSCGCLYYMLDRITFHKKKKKNCLIKLQSACIIFDILLKLGGFKDSMFKPQTV